MNLNVHVHALVLDGFYVEDGTILRFHEAMPPTDDETDRLLGTIDRRIHRLLARRGVLDDFGEARGMIRGGRRHPCWPASPERRCRGGGPSASGPVRRCAGMRCVRPSRRTGCTLTAEGQVVLDLRHRRADGTTQRLFEPVELLERLAALTPRPRINLLLYYGALGAGSAWWSRLQPRERETAVTAGHARLT